MGRKTRLHLEHETLFSGLFWTGEDALKLGLVDGFADMREVEKEMIHAEVIVDYTPRVNLLDKLTHKLGASLAHALYSGFIPKGIQ